MPQIDPPHKISMLHNNKSIYNHKNSGSHHVFLTIMSLGLSLHARCYAPSMSSTSGRTVVGKESADPPSQPEHIATLRPPLRGGTKGASGRQCEHTRKNN